MNPTPLSNPCIPFLQAAAALLCAALAGPCAAQASAAQQAAAPGTPPPIVLPDLSDRYIPKAPADDTLYRELGGEAGLHALVDLFYEKLMADPRLTAYFRIAEPAHFKRTMAAEFCFVAGGPCTRKANVRRLHSSMDIDKASFNAVVEVLQSAMTARSIAFSTQNRLLAQLAPMHRDVVNME